MMPGNPSDWWSMHSNLRSSSSSAGDHHHHHQHEAEVVPTNLLISQTHPSNSLLPPLHYHHGGSSSSSSASASSSSSSSLLPFMSSNSANPHAQDFPHSWSQLLLGGLTSEQDQERFNPNEFEAARAISGGVQVDVKQEGSNQSNNNNNNNNILQLYGSQFHEEHDQASAGVGNNRGAAAAAAWTQLVSASLSPKSCITTLSSSNTTTNSNNNNISSSNMLDFSTNHHQADNHQHADHNSECNSTATTGGVPPKKPRVQSSSTPPLKVRKEKLGDRITALHQLVSPFGKTDTASVLLEAIGYIRFLQGQIEVFSSPYMGSNNASANSQHSVHGERNCLFPDHPGQLLNDSCLKRRRAANQEDNNDVTKDLKSRGLCLVPISIIQLVGSDNVADYWEPPLGGGF